MTYQWGNKAENLKELSKIVSVPCFTVINGEGELMNFSLKEQAYAIRSIGDSEDGLERSNAGKYKTYLNIKPNKVVVKARTLLREAMVKKVVIQKYIPGGSGVAFLSSPENIIAQWSNVSEGVTSGVVDPFVTDFSDNQYSALGRELKKVCKHFGPCEVEFIDIENPQLVQVRPITASVAGDLEKIKLKEFFQNLESDIWIENSFCQILTEKKYDYDYIQSYPQIVRQSFKDLFGREIIFPEIWIVGLSRQYFMDGVLEQSLKLGFIDLMKLGIKEKQILENTQSVLENNRSTFKDLLQVDYQISMLSSLFRESQLKFKQIFQLREKIRVRLESLASKKQFPVTLKYKEKLQSPLIKDSSFQKWISFKAKEKPYEWIGRKDESIFDGEFKRLKNLKGIDQESLRGKVLVLDQLTPEIAQFLAEVKGVICFGGSAFSHGAILCRELDVPAVVQVDEKWLKDK